MRAQLANARQRNRNRIVGIASVRQPRPHQRLEDHDILPHAQRAEHYAALQDLSGTRVDYARAIRPAPGRAIDPIDDIVAHVERIDVCWKNFNAKSIDKARFVKRFCPPANTINQRLAHGLWRGPINVIDNRLFHRTALGRRIDFLQAVPFGQIDQHGFAQRRRKVIGLRAERKAIGIGAPRHRIIRQFDKRMAHP